MVTIQNLEVQFDVEGEKDEAVFKRLFDRHIDRWNREQEDKNKRKKQADGDRSLRRDGNEEKA